MNVKLKVVQGKLKGKDGENAGLEVAISKSRFVIGTATDCNMRCPSSTISPHHCEITVRDGKVRLRDLDSESGTYVNDERIGSERLIQAGDRLRVGRLEFEALIELPAPSKKADAVDDYVSDMLAQADEEERATRMATPELRQFHLNANDAINEPAEPEEDDRATALRKKLPQKKPPGKLPPKPSITAESSVSAAEQTLEKLLKPKPKGPKH